MIIKLGTKVFKLENPEKVRRAIEGSVGYGGGLVGGVGRESSPSDKLAEYDRLGGYITMDGAKVKTGSFYDPKNKCKREKPQVVLIFRDINGEEVELKDGEEKPLTVVAAEVQKARKTAKKAKK